MYFYLFGALGYFSRLPVDLNDLFIKPYQNDNARVHTNSWGAPVAGAYNANSEEVDEFVYNHRDFVICFAAGNEGVDLDGNGTIDAKSIGSPGTAKNCITVGASESYRPNKVTSYGDGKPRYGNPWPIDFPVPPIEDDLWASNVNGMAAFSSRGPAQGNRIKPDVVAPGTAILSTHSRDANVGAFWGESIDPLFCFMGGTSMSTPLVAGCVAVVREFLIRDRAHLNPSAALVKAMLINGAEEITGQYSPSEAGTIPNFSQGFGRVNLAATVGPFDPDVTIEFRDENRALRAGEEESITIDLDSTVTLLKVTLVWTDPPGAALQNDLDLIVRARGEERHGNVPSTSSEFDRTNNLEQILWSGIPIGNVEIVVKAYRALPPQTYALVIRSI
jgi:serine protease AprX